jgi:cell division protease FtsH
MKMKNLKKYKNRITAIGFTVALIAVFVAAFLTDGFTQREEPVFVPYAAFLEAVDDGRVAEVFISPGAMLRFTFTAYENTEYITNNPRRVDLKESLLLAGVTVTETPAGVNFLALGGVVIAVGAVMFIISRRTGAVKNGLQPATVGIDAEADAKRANIGFGDIAGNVEAKENVTDIIDYLRSPEKFTRYGARMPRGILLHGKPGTGKTLMARAMAGEAGVPFYAVSGSDFVQMYVGVGAARVRDLFKKARTQGRGIIFIDEIDALGKKRGDGISGNDEREQTLNALLTEMQGFSENEGIVVIAATNRIDTLDEALLRPGRFDRRVEVGLPDINARRQILALHARNKPLTSEESLEKLARDTVYFSGAMLEGLLNDAAIHAAQRENGFIDEADLSAAYYTAIAGAQKKDRSALHENDRLITAYHEAGHAIAAALTSPENRIAKLTIIPSSGGAGGFCVNIPPERMYHTKKGLEKQIITAFAGRCAEEIRFGEENITTGAANDIEKATDLIMQYVTRFGFGTGILDRTKLEDKHSTAWQCHELAERLYAESRTLLQKNNAALEALAARLLEAEMLDSEEVAGVIAPLLVRETDGFFADGAAIPPSYFPQVLLPIREGLLGLHPAS